MTYIITGDEDHHIIQCYMTVLKEHFVYIQLLIGF